MKSFFPGRHRAGDPDSTGSAGSEILIVRSPTSPLQSGHPLATAADAPAIVPGAAIGKPPTISEAARDYIDALDRDRAKREPTPEEVEAYRQARMGSGNVGIKLILGSMYKLQQEMKAWLSEHPKNCDCAFCDDEKRALGQTMRRDLRGVLWALDLVSGSMSSLVYPIRDEEMEELGLVTVGEDGLFRGPFRPFLFAVVDASKRKARWFRLP
jgi:hypothetical protein